MTTCHLVRATFLVLMGLIVSTQFVRIRATALPAVSDTLEQDLRMLGLNGHPADIPQPLAVSGPKCEQPLLLTTINFDGAGSAIAYDLLRLPGTARFIYLGFVGRTPNPGQIAIRWVAGTALYVLGMREGSAPRQVLLVLIPQSCSHLEQLDWAVLSPWD